MEKAIQDAYQLILIHKDNDKAILSILKILVCDAEINLLENLQKRMEKK